MFCLVQSHHIDSLCLPSLTLSLLSAGDDLLSLPCGPLLSECLPPQLGLLSGTLSQSQFVVALLDILLERRELHKTRLVRLCRFSPFQLQPLYFLLCRFESCFGSGHFLLLDVSCFASNTGASPSFSLDTLSLFFGIYFMLVLLVLSLVFGPYMSLFHRLNMQFHLFSSDLRKCVGFLLGFFCILQSCCFCIRLCF